MLRVQLISTDNGVLVIDGSFGNADPDGINDLKQELKRSDIADGVMRNIIVELGFQQLSKQFLEQCFSVSGPDSEVVCNIFEFNQTTRLFDTVYFTGKIDFNTLVKTEDFWRLTIAQTGFQETVLNNIDTQIDLEDPNDTVPIQSYDIGMHSKKIKYDFVADGADSEGFRHVPSGQYMTIDPTSVTINDIKTKNDLGIEVSSSLPKPNWIMNEDGSYSFDIYVESNYGDGFGMADVDVFYSINGAGETAFARVDDTAFRSSWTLNQTIALKKGDEFRYYFKNNGAGEALVNINTFTEFSPLRVNVSNLSSFPASTCKVFFIGDCIRAGVRQATLQEDCYKSTLTARYEVGGVDGPAALDGITVGHLVRKRDKKCFLDLKTLLKLIEDLHCASYGFETDDSGVQRVVVEKKEYFYDKSNYSVDLGKVYNIEYKFNYDRMFNNFIHGFSTAIDIGIVNGVDGFNTLRTENLSLKNSKNTKSYSNPIIADGYQIEFTRRLIASTQDGRYDDKLFLINARRGGDVGIFNAARDEDFSEINGVIDSPSGYNYNYSPGRILKNWYNFLAQCVMYGDNKKVRFTSGTGNYGMSTRTTTETELIYENGTVDLEGYEPLTTPFDIIYSCGCTNDQFREIKKYPYRYILCEDKNNNLVEGFISTEGISHNPTTGLADFNLMQVFRK